MGRQAAVKIENGESISIWRLLWSLSGKNPEGLQAEQDGYYCPRAAHFLKRAKFMFKKKSLLARL